MTISATELRANLYKLLDLVAKKGETIEIVHGGKVLKIVLKSPRNKMKNLVERPECLKGDPDEIIHMDWLD